MSSKDTAEARVTPIPEIQALPPGAEILEEQTAPPGTIDPKVEQRILRTLDFRVVPILWFLFLVSFIDRGNIANAKIQGMEEELHLVKNDYNNAYWVFTLSYVVFGVPANLLFQKFGPKSLSVMMFCWGLTVLGQGLTKTYAGLVVCRFLEGICEAGFVPGCASLIGSYYKRDEFLRRYVVFYSAANVAGAFNGLLANLLAKMDGDGGYAGWRWIFIIESLVTMLVSIGSFFVLVEFPEKTKIFTTEEKGVLLARLRQDGGESPRDRKKEIFLCLRDWKIWAATIVYFAAEENASSVVAFQPTVLKGLGYTSAAAQVHTIPVYCVACVVSILCCFASEYLGKRYWFGMLGVLLEIIGLSIELGQPHAAGARYAGMFFLVSGYSIIMPITVVWLAVNVGKGYKRTVALGMVIAVGNCGAFISSNVFVTSQTPKFHTGFSVGLGMAGISALFLTILAIGMYYGNCQKSEKRATLPANPDEWQQKEVLGDKHPDFRFAL
ncbi:MFS general substrate transporter [Viridothelium virens]|uniref:MFS general substrate transporter n=1 Tax=Viridothelium virens TaxID=1048519 RepID=A0A6A6HA32_VIRVR|nr:MFS general substrate transporter [Viridothelium virens]